VSPRASARPRGGEIAAAAFSARRAAPRRATSRFSATAACALLPIRKT